MTFFSEMVSSFDKRGVNEHSAQKYLMSRSSLIGVQSAFDILCFAGATSSAITATASLACI